MGNQVATPGKSHGPADSIRDQAHAQTHSIGKMSRVEAEYGNSVSPERDPGEFLTDKQSADLDRQISFRLGILSKNYSLALMTLKVEQMIKKPDELGIFLTLCLGVLESVLTGYGGLAVKLLRKKGTPTAALSQLGGEVAKSAVKSAVSDVAQAGKDAEKAAVNLTEVQLNSVIKTSLGKGKTKASSVLASTSSNASEAENDKAQATSYIDYLMNNSDIELDKLSQALGHTSEITRLAWWTALEPSQHSESMYETKLRAQLAKYMADPVSKIGRSEEWAANGLGQPTHVEKEVSIARIVMIGGIVRYAEQDKRFDAYLHDHPEKAQRSPAYDADQGALSLEQDATWNIGGKEQQHHETPIKEQPNLTFVDSEFEKLAVKKQERTWQKPIETYDLTFTAAGYKLARVAGY